MKFDPMICEKGSNKITSRCIPGNHISGEKISRTACLRSLLRRTQKEVVPTYKADYDVSPILWQHPQLVCLILS